MSIFKMFKKSTSDPFANQLVLQLNKKCQGYTSLVLKSSRERTANFLKNALKIKDKTLKSLCKIALMFMKYSLSGNCLGKLGNIHILLEVTDEIQNTTQFKMTQGSRVQLK